MKPPKKPTPSKITTPPSKTVPPPLKTTKPGFKPFPKKGK